MFTFEGGIEYIQNQNGATLGSLFDDLGSKGASVLITIFIWSNYWAGVFLVSFRSFFCRVSFLPVPVNYVFLN